MSEKIPEESNRALVVLSGLAFLMTKKMADGMSQEEAMKATMEEVAEQMAKPRSKEEIEESARQVEKLFGRTCV